MNEAEGDCSIDIAAMVVGLIFLVSIMIMEMWSFLLVQLSNKPRKLLSGVNSVHLFIMCVYRGHKRTISCVHSGAGSSR